MKKLVIIIGLAGSGKSSVVQYFQDHPIQNWIFYDFDEGEILPPENTATKETKRDWRMKQHKLWLERVLPDLQNTNVVLMGVAMFPWVIKGDGIIPDAQIQYGFLNIDEKLRKKRLVERNNVELFEENLEKYTAIYNKMRDFGAFEINANPPLIEVVKQVEMNLKEL